MAGCYQNSPLMETRRGKGIAAILAVLLCALYSLPAHAQWEVIYPAPSSGTSEPIAQVDNRTGHSLRVYRHDNNHVYAVFSIQERFDTFHQGACPTYVVDGKLPSDLGSANISCELKARKAVFDLGTVSAKQLHSSILLQWMNGSRLSFRYHLKTVGYREAQFSLKSSSRAVATILGAGVRVIAESSH